MKKGNYVHKYHMHIEVGESDRCYLESFCKTYGLKYDVDEIKRTPVEIMEDIQQRYKKSGFRYVERFIKEDTTFVLLKKKNKVFMGYARQHPDDSWNSNIGYYVALARACGYKDLEEELIESLGV